MPMSPNVVLVGIGGPSCSGKTTLAKHLENIIPGCYLLHQDDYAPPEELIPFLPGSCPPVRDWDAAPTAIEWQRFVDDLAAAKEGLSLDESKRSHEHLGLLLPVPISEATTKKWATAFADHPGLKSGKTKIVLVDGFLMYWYPPVQSLLDVRILIRERKDILQKRRSARNDRIAEDSFWKDPPGIFDSVVWPAYTDAHEKLFERADVESGTIKPDTKIVLMEASEVSLDQMVERTCAEVFRHMDSLLSGPNGSKGKEEG